jgi:hemoglobin/transferrin/lactoferrin receptor protein
MQKRYFLPGFRHLAPGIAMFLLFPLAVFSQAPADSSELDLVPLKETVVSASGASQSRTAVTQQVAVLRRAEIERVNAQTTADLLQNSGHVFVQKSQQGGGSPVLRGFEASRVLLVVDGVRMNNAIYRAGHLQNIVTVDNNTLEKAEVLFGPASTLYGSDALGGALCFFTKNPILAGEKERLKTTGSAFFRYGTVNREKTGHADVSLGWKKFGVLSSFTLSDFGDLRMGAREGSAPLFGRRDFYVERIGGRDSLVKNSDPLIQRFSAYRQYDFLQKWYFKPNEYSNHAVNIQVSTSSDIPRYDRLTDPGGNGTGLRSAEWYYGPQDRFLASYQYNLTRAGWFDQVQAVASWQVLEESRHTRRFRQTGLTSRVESVQVGSLTLNARKNWELHSIQMGLDAQYNDVQSEAREKNIDTGAEKPASTRYPDGGSTLATAAVYVAHNWQTRHLGERLNITEGFRVGYTRLRAGFVDRQFFPFPYDEATQSTPVFSGNLGAAWAPFERFRVSVNTASAFRVPNVDDLGKVFDSQPGSLIVPNPALTPEKTFNFDLGLAYHIAGRLRWENTVWNTFFRDAIVVAPFRFNGQDSVLYEGVKSRVFAPQNQRNARLWGFASVLEADLSAKIAGSASLGYTHGRIIDPEGRETPLDHIPPLYGRVALRYHTARAGLEGFVLFNAAKPIAEYQLNGEDNEAYAPPGGMPAWWTFNLRGQYRLARWVTIQAGVENMLDVQYRTFASGINGPGRNLYTTLRVQW